MKTPRAIGRPALIALALAAFAGPAGAQETVSPAWQILAPPSAEWNIVYRLNRSSGEITGCAYIERAAGNVTTCYPAMDHARGGDPGPYTLAASNNSTVISVYRLNERTGEISLCWVAGWKNTLCAPEDE
ncbi:MAG: hypothetical protein AAGC92_15290 [Pseudomonadota bacterium]